MNKNLILIVSFSLFIIGCATKSPEVKIVDKNDTNCTNYIDINITKTIKTPKLILGGYYEDSVEVKEFIDDLVTNYNYDYNYLVKLFTNLKFQNRALNIIAPKRRVVTLRNFIKRDSNQFKKKVVKKRKRRRFGSWDRYRNRTITKKRVDNGVEFYKRYKETLQKAYKEYGVTPEYIVGLLGIETKYGSFVGSFPVFDTLATLGFEKHRRCEYFKNELKHFLLMVKSEDLNISKIVGSYAGAIGYGQFMPSNFEKFAVDFDNDGIKDLWNAKDAIGSVANYLNQHGWRKDEPIAVRAKYRGKRFRRLRTGYKTRYSLKRLKKRYKIRPRERFKYKKRVSLIKLNRRDYDEIWLGAKNFYVITRYNHSSYYAMAIHQLSKKIKKQYLNDY